MVLGLAIRTCEYNKTMARVVWLQQNNGTRTKNKSYNKTIVLGLAIRTCEYNKTMARVVWVQQNNGTRSVSTTKQWHAYEK
jgi:hypothetical protein